MSTTAHHPGTLVRPLFSGPLDIIADVHGEIDALRSLLRHLGYREDGTHAEGRRVVFVGDLTDREQRLDRREPTQPRSLGRRRAPQLRLHGRFSEPRRL